MGFPKLPARAAYLTLSNPARRNALSLSVLRNLKAQLEGYNADETGRKTLFLPASGQPDAMISPQLSLERYKWLYSSEEWNKRRGHQPKVLVLRSEGPVFSSGHDLAELSSLNSKEVKETFETCRKVMLLIEKCPVPVVCAIQGISKTSRLKRSVLNQGNP